MKTRHDEIVEEISRQFGMSVKETEKRMKHFFGALPKHNLSRNERKIIRKVIEQTSEKQRNKMFETMNKASKTDDSLVLKLRPTVAKRINKIKKEMEEKDDKVSYSEVMKFILKKADLWILD